jgi:hypothetical protein
MSDYPYTKENHIFDRSRRHAGDLLDISHNIYQMRQLSIATIISVPDDHILYVVHLLNEKNSHKVNAYLLGDPNHWNIIGYPKQGDLVLIMHQRKGGDAHILQRLQNKLVPILDTVTLANNDGIPTGLLTP